MGLVSLPLGASNSGSNDWADVHNEDQAIVDVVNGGISNANLSGSAAITDANLASPNSGLYKVLFSSSGFLGGDSAAGAYLLGSAGGTELMWASAENISVSGAAPTYRPPDIFHAVAADYNISGKTETLTFRAIVAANATAPGINFTFTLCPITVAGGADTMTYTAGTAITGGSLAINTPSASTVTLGTADTSIAFPSDGAYAFVCTTSNTLANNCSVSVHAQLMIQST